MKSQDLPKKKKKKKGRKATVHFEQVQKFILVKKISWGQGHFKGFAVNSGKYFRQRFWEFCSYYPKKIPLERLLASWLLLLN